MNGYIFFFEGVQYDVYAETTSKAQDQGVAMLQKKFPRRKIKSWQVDPNLAERNTTGPDKPGEQVVHIAVN